MTAAVLLERHGSVAKITLTRPDKLNAFTTELHAGLRDALTELECAADVACLLITGAGRAFCAGQDLNERVRPQGQPPVDLGETLARDMNPLMSRLRAFPAPVVAVVNGVAAGAGASLALAADMVLACRSAKFSFGFCRIGLIPDGGASWALPRLVGPARAIGLALTGEAVSAQQAADWGLIWKCLEDEELAAEATRLASFFATQSRPALAAAKQLLAASWNNGAQAQFELERTFQQRLGAGADYAEGVVAFIEKRTPLYGKATS